MSAKVILPSRRAITAARESVSRSGFALDEDFNHAFPVHVIPYELHVCHKRSKVVERDGVGRDGVEDEGFVLGGGRGGWRRGEGGGGGMRAAWELSKIRGRSKEKQVSQAGAAQHVLEATERTEHGRTSRTQGGPAWGPLTLRTLLQCSQLW